MPTDLSRLLKLRSICAIDGREAERVVEQCRRMGFAGPVYAVHPARRAMAGLPCFPSVYELPEAPDAAFVGVRRDRTVEVVRTLAARGAGGAVCYASGFAESGARGAALQAALVEAAGDMPILGPNCFGFVNYLEGAPLWPDQHGGMRRDRGVAIVSQSSNLSITLTMNLRAVPIAAVVTLGNRARVGTADALETLLEDDRITAVGLVVETLEDAPALAVAARKARERRIPLVACKLGQSEEGARLTVSHTASLAGSERSAVAFLRRTGIGRVHSLPALLEALKLLHAGGPLDGRDIASLSCSGGEAAVNGMAVGGGLEIAISCDLILAADHARFALPEINVGVLADAASIKLHRRIPFHVAMDLLLTGRWMETEEAARWGLVNEVVPAGNLMDRAREVADLLAAGPPLVFAAIKETIRMTERLTVADAFGLMHGKGIPAVNTLYASDDLLEGTRAFAEKRAPVWRGR